MGTEVYYGDSLVELDYVRLAPHGARALFERPDGTRFMRLRVCGSESNVGVSKHVDTLDHPGLGLTEEFAVYGTRDGCICSCFRSFREQEEYRVAQSISLGRR